MTERIDEGEELLPQEGPRRRMDVRAPIAFLIQLVSPGRQAGTGQKVDKEADCLEEVSLAENVPRRKIIELRTFITSVTGLILAILSFVFGVGCGLGIGVPYYGASLSDVFSRPSTTTFNAYGVPDKLPVIPISQLINKTELDLETNFAVSGVPAVREYEFNISHGLAAPDGFWKPMILVNNQSPGPLIEANTGDTVRVRVNNHMPNASTSIHFHGIDQHNTTWMDGVAAVSQCGIPPGSAWTYEFAVGDQRGTFWYHSHAALQYTDGLYGPMVVHDPDEEVPATEGGRVVFLGASYHSYAGELAGRYLAPGSPWDPGVAGVEPLCDGLVMNGQGVSDCGVPSTTYNSSSSSSYGGGPACTGGQMYTTTIRPGTALRLRLINHSSYLSYWFSIDSHNVTIVEMDGVEIEPVASRGVHVNIGQRYSVIVRADQEVGDYYIRQTLERDCFLPYSTYSSSGLEAIGYQAKGVLRYERAEGDGQDGLQEGIGTEVKTMGTEGSTTNPWGCNDMPFDLPVPMRREAAYDMGEGDPSHIVDYQFRQVGEVNRIFINKTSWSPYEADALLWRAMEKNFTTGSGGVYHNWGLRLDQQVLLVPDGSRAAQVVINSLDAMEHPFHMHGHSVQVVGWGPGRYDPSSPTSSSSSGGGTTTWNLVNPLRRDTFTVPADSHVIIRFMADNPGIWVLHCHVAWHLEAGMLVSLIERPGDLKTLVQGMDPEVRALSQSFCGKPTS